MKSWLFLLGGLLIWTVHFFGIYAIGSLLPGNELANWAVLAHTALSLGAAGWLLLLLVRRKRTQRHDDLDRWSSALAGWGYALAIVAVIFQGLPAIVS